MTAGELLARAPGLSLRRDAQGLTLVGKGVELRGDFARMKPRLRPNALGAEALVRAAKIKTCGSEPLAIDATAGLGEDALLLAAAGFRVILYEYNPVIAALLDDALTRARQDATLSAAVARMELRQQDSIPALAQSAQRPDVVLLDPMFPARQKSGQIKKKFQLLQQLEPPCATEAALLEAAFLAQPEKILVKRPAKAAPLAARRPSYTVPAGNVRIDCYVPKRA